LKPTGAGLLLGLALVLSEVAARLVLPVPEVSNFNRIAFTPIGIFGGMDEISGADPTPPMGRSKAPRYPLRNVVVTWASEPDGRTFSHALNLYGFRGPDFRVQRRAEARRVLFLGDSFAEGFGAQNDETLPVVFEQLSGNTRTSKRSTWAWRARSCLTTRGSLAWPSRSWRRTGCSWCYTPDFPLHVSGERPTGAFTARWNP
jgi:hypothetical protein